VQLLNTLYVTLPDSHLRLDNDTLRLLVGDETRLRVPLHHLGAVVCFGPVSVSVPLMHRLADDSIALVLLDSNGRFKARLEGATAGNVLLRRAQHDTSQDGDFALMLARRIVAGKLRNQRHVLLRGARDAKDEGDRRVLTRSAQNIAASQRALPAASTLDTVRGIEGEAARGYFAAQPSGAARLAGPVQHGRPQPSAPAGSDERTSIFPVRDVDERLPQRVRSRRAGPAGGLPARAAARSRRAGAGLDGGVQADG